MLGLFNSNVTTKFVQVQHFLSQNIGGTKYIVCPLVQKLGGMFPPETRSVHAVVFVVNAALRVNGSTAHASFPCTHPLTPNMRLKRPQVVA